MLELLNHLRPIPHWAQLEIEVTGTRVLGQPPSSSVPAQLTWGYVLHKKRIVAAYSVEWCPGRPDLRAHFSIILGNWKEGSTPEQRQIVSLEFNSQGEFMVVDSLHRLDIPSIATHKLVRSQVVGKAIARKVFAFADAVVMKEPNLSEVRCWREQG